MRRRRSLRCSSSFLFFLCSYACFCHAFQVTLSLESGDSSKAQRNTTNLNYFVAASGKLLSSSPSPSPQPEEAQDDMDTMGSAPGVAPHPFPIGSPSSSLQPFPPISPVLSGFCPFNFTSAANVLSETATDCPSTFASYLGNVVCCPQFKTMLHILMGQSSKVDGQLALNSTTADYCFSDIQYLLINEGANSSLPLICSAHPYNLTEGSCPVKSVKEFEEIVNTSSLLEACKVVDPVKECCNPVCQPAIMEAAHKLASKTPGLYSSDYLGMSLTQKAVTGDCETVAFRWLASKLPFADAKAALRGLFNCNVNKVCPLSFPNPSEVTRSCANPIENETKCCTKLGKYISAVQQQSFITNLQALDCAASLGKKLQSKNVTENVYNLCRVNLRDFSLQAGPQGCLFQSLPTDLTIDKVTGISFHCDLNDNIAAPWPSSLNSSTPSSCNKQVNMPAFPVATSAWNGKNGAFVMALVLSAFCSTLLLS